MPEQPIEKRTLTFMKALPRAIILGLGLMSCVIGLPCVYAAALSFMRTDMPYTQPQKLVAAILGGVYPVVVGMLLLCYWFQTRARSREADHEPFKQGPWPRPVPRYIHLPPKEVLRLLFGTALLWMGVALVLSYLYVPYPSSDLPQPINPLNGALLLLFFAARVFWKAVKRQRNG